MNAPYPALPKISLKNSITAPELAVFREPQTDLTQIIEQAGMLREILSSGEGNAASFSYGRHKIGFYLARAAIQNNVEGVIAAAELYIHNNQRRHRIQTPKENVLFDILKELSTAGRNDLLRPILATVREACWQRWQWNAEHRKDWRAIFSINTMDPGNRFPEIQERDLTEQELIHNQAEAGKYNFCFAGENAWRVIGQAMAQTQVHDINWSTDIPAAMRLSELLAMYKDITTTIPDARSWAKSLIVSVTKQAREMQDFWNDDRNAKNLMGMALVLNDTETCSLMRFLSEKTALDISYSEQEFLDDIISFHPNISIGDWMVLGLRQDLLAEDWRKRNERILQADDNDDASALVALLDVYDLQSRYEHVFDYMIRKIGLDGPLGGTPQLQKLMNELVAWQQEEKTISQYPNIKVAQDKMILTEGIPRTSDTPALRKPRGRKI